MISIISIRSEFRHLCLKFRKSLHSFMHTFHIPPVMGIGYSIYTPIKMALFWITSVMSLGDDQLIERIRKLYSGQFKLPFEPIPTHSEDARAKRS